MTTNKKPTMVTEEEIDKVWGHANFGDSISKMHVVKFGTLKGSCGLHQGHTSKQIVMELGLLTRTGKATARGRFCLWEWFGFQSRV